ELGLNCLRCHIKAPDPRYYEVADRFGLLVWTELPNGGLFTERSRAQHEATLTGILDRDYNHPSIIVWTIINENWGIDLVHDPDQIRNPDGSEPWWFETGHDWGEGVMYPHGVKHRFADWSLNRVFGDLKAFVTAAQWQQFAALKYQIEIMRREPVLAGYVITEL